MQAAFKMPFVDETQYSFLRILNSATFVLLFFHFKEVHNQFEDRGRMTNGFLIICKRILRIAYKFEVK
jgi:hypothetical protein